jgi:coproporphyrinogen III oxidase-like Fe-S oxidoreductase
MMPTEAKDIERWMEIGVNRFSVGVQTTNQGLLEGVNRGGYHQGQLLQVLKQLKEVNLNIDMMIGMN